MCSKIVSVLMVAIVIAAVGSGNVQSQQKNTQKHPSMPTGVWLYETQIIGDNRPLTPEILEQIWLEITEKSLIRCGANDYRQESKLISHTERDPMEFDLEFTHPISKKVTISKGIYKLEGDRLTICYDNTGKSRPKKFEAAQPEGYDPINGEAIVFSVLKRKK
jgi:uncharacterized protein (TIGR03067 family)